MHRHIYVETGRWSSCLHLLLLLSSSSSESDSESGSWVFSLLLNSNMGSTGMTPGRILDSDEEASAFAMQLVSASVLPMVLKSTLELDVLEIIAKAGPGAFVSSSEIIAQLHTQNPDATVMLDRMLRFLAHYAVLKCTLRHLPDGGVERLYGLTPVCKFFIRNQDGVSLAPLLLMNQDKILMESWYSLHLISYPEIKYFKNGFFFR